MAAVMVLGVVWGAVRALSGLRDRVLALEKTADPDLAKKVDDLVERVVRVETRTDLFMTALESWSVKVLHSPHAPDRDRLLEKLQDGSITKDEAMALRGLLEIQYDGDPRSPHGLAYTLLLAKLNQILHEEDD